MEKSTLPYDKKLIGKFIAFGAENIVYHYSDKQVIKFPTFYSLRYLWDKKRYCDELKHGFEILNQYLKNHINDSVLNFYTRRKNPIYVVIESFIQGNALTKRDLENDRIKDQFNDIVKVKNELEQREKIFLDLFGLWGLLIFGGNKISNLLVEKNTKKIYLVDIGTARLDDTRFIISILLKLAQWRQNQLLKRYLNGQFSTKQY